MSGNKWVIKTRMDWQDDATTYETVEISKELLSAIHTHVADQLIARAAGKLTEEDRSYMYRRMVSFEIHGQYDIPQLCGEDVTFPEEGAK